VSTNKAENFFSQLKRSIDGTHHHVSVQHLDRYMDEFAFRHTDCNDTDTERMIRIIGRATGRGMSYKRPSDRWRRSKRRPCISAPFTHTARARRYSLLTFDPVSVPPSLGI